ncbi:10278_t:CDS:2, partial [Scutellospora calospora]
GQPPEGIFDDTQRHQDVYACLCIHPFDSDNNKNQHGLTGKAAEYAVKKYRKHRTINEDIMNRVNELLK